jgi:NNP family nitrate/nitrite transporter-like MFS transporter
VLPTNLLPAAVVLQPIVAVGFFPAALTQISKLGPPRSRNVALSLNIAIAVTVGGGFFPWLGGILGEVDAFWLSFVLLGAGMGVVSPLLLRQISKA